MTKTIYFVASSVDGFIADVDGQLAWLTRYEGGDGMRAHYEAFLAGVGALAMGASTYLFLRAHGVEVIVAPGENEPNRGTTTGAVGLEGTFRHEIPSDFRDHPLPRM